jgi:hypothetical protein
MLEAHRQCCELQIASMTDKVEEPLSVSHEGFTIKFQMNVLLDLPPHNAGELAGKSGSWGTSKMSEMSLPYVILVAV